MENNRQGINGHLPSLTTDFVSESGNSKAGVEEAVEIPLRLSEDPRLVALFEENHVGAERFRVLAGRLQYLQKQHGIRRVAITSAEQGEGKSVIAANLALTLARRQPTLLIDGDLRRSGLKVLFGTQHARGLADWWSSEEDVRGFLMRAPNRLFWHLPAGQDPAQPLEVLQSPRIGTLLRSLSDSFDWIIIDSPPLVPVTDGHIWSNCTDGTLLVVRQGKTVRRLLQTSLENAENLKLLGAVMNCVREPRHQYYYSPSYGQTRPRAAKPSSDKSTNSSTEWSATR